MEGTFEVEPKSISIKSGNIPLLKVVEDEDGWCVLVVYSGGTEFDNILAEVNMSPVERGLLRKALSI